MHSYPSFRILTARLTALRLSSPSLKRSVSGKISTDMAAMECVTALLMTASASVNLLRLEECFSERCIISLIGIPAKRALSSLRSAFPDDEASGNLFRGRTKSGTM